MKVILFGRESCVASCSYMGAIALHGPHQSAWTRKRRPLVFKALSGEWMVGEVDGGERLTICYDDMRGGDEGIELRRRRDMNYLRHIEG